MQAMRLLKSSDWTMVAGAVVALSLAVSLSLTLLLARPVRVDASGNFTSPQRRINETVGVAIADNFQHRWQPTDDMPLKPVPRRDPFAGLIGGLLTQPLAQDVPQAKQVEGDLAGAQQPGQQVTMVPQAPPTPPSDVCARRGLRRVVYTQNHHRYWRCARQRTS